MTLVHQFDRRGNHRIVIRLANFPDVNGPWAGYQMIALAQHGGRHFAASTDYHAVWGCAVVETKNPDTVQKTEVLDA